MWDVRIDKEEVVLGLHYCEHENAWLKESDGWAICNFMFEDFYEDEYRCPACKEKIPKEMVDFYALCKAMEPSNSKHSVSAEISNLINRN